MSCGRGQSALVQTAGLGDVVQVDLMLKNGFKLEVEALISKDIS